MKYFKPVAMAALAGCFFGFTSCDEDEDGFYNERYMETTQIVEIQTQPSYSVGDYLFVTADISRYLQEIGQPDPLDIFTTTGGAQQFTFTYRLEKRQNDDTFASVVLSTNDLEIISGEAQSTEFIVADAVYNPVLETYVYHVGMPLLEPGQYRFSYGVNSDAIDKVELRSRSQGNNLNLNIISRTTQLDNQGFYTFQVQ